MITPIVYKSNRAQIYWIIHWIGHLLDRIRIVAEDAPRGQTVSGSCRTPKTQSDDFDPATGERRILNRGYFCEGMCLLAR